MSTVKTRNLTTLDFLKTAALLIMFCDHVGFYFFVPSGAADDPTLWFRAIGRCCVPIWFFLVGYAKSRDLSWPIWAWGGALIAMSVVVGSFIFPLNILFTIIVVRLTLDIAARVAFMNIATFIGTIVILCWMLPLTAELIDYGCMGIILSLAGYAARHRGEPYGLLAWRHVDMLALLTALSIYVVHENIYFNLSPPQFLVMTLGCTSAMLLCLRLPKQEWPTLTSRVSVFSAALLRLGGRRTMEIYVIHISVFMLICLIFKIGAPYYGWFDWKLTFAQALAQAFSTQ